MGLQAQNWFYNILRGIFAGLDWIVYSLIRWILFGVFDLSNLTTSSGLMNGIYRRIYVILGVFMAFKLMFSFFQYIVNPEEMSSKNEKGASKLIGRTAIMILALIAIPGILFSREGGAGLIQRAQTAFLPMLPRVLLGVETATGAAGAAPSTDNDISKASNVMAMSTLQAFFAPSKELDAACGGGTYNDTPAVNSLGEFMASINLTCNVRDKSVIDASKVYRYSYSYIISTIVGILMAVMLLGITIDVAKRVFKMIILEVIAPIPIMTLIDPKSSKDGAFSKWVKSLISTFLDIFIKLGLLYVVIMMVQLIVNNGLFSNLPSFGDSPMRALYLRVLLIVGLIFFAKEAPKFIKDSLGIKSEGGSSAMGKLTGALTGGVTGAVAGAVSGRGFRGALTGMATGASAGFGAAGTGKPSNAWSTARDAAGAARTGDSKYKGGILNGITNAATSSQQQARARRMGITTDTLSIGKKNVEKLTSQAADSKDAYDRYLKNKLGLKSSEAQTALASAGYTYNAATGFYNNGTNDVDDATMNDELRRVLYNKMTTDETKATKASKAYEKAGKIGELYNVDISAQEKMGLSRRQRDRYNARHRSQENVRRTNEIIDAARSRGAYDPGARAIGRGQNRNIDQR